MGQSSFRQGQEYDRNTQKKAAVFSKINPGKLDEKYLVKDSSKIKNHS